MKTLFSPAMATITLVSLIAGCTGARALVQLPSDHPANPQATASPLPPTSTTLRIVPSSGKAPATMPFKSETDHGELPHGGSHGPASEPHDVDDTDHAHDPVMPEATRVGYACPMHPEVTADQPDQRCPRCGMELVPRDSAGDTP